MLKLFGIIMTSDFVRAIYFVNAAKRRHADISIPMSGSLTCDKLKIH